MKIDMKTFLKKNYAVFIFAFLFFLIGTENGGYQITLINITSDLQLTETVKGIVVAVQYLAILVVPLAFGSIADKFDKKKITLLFVLIFLAGCLVITFAYSTAVFVIGIFLVGSGIAIIQTLISAQLIDIYPASNSKKMTIAQIFYSLGAVLSPLIFDVLMKNGMSWRFVFTIIGIICIIGFIGYYFLDNHPQEKVFVDGVKQENKASEKDAKARLPWLYITIFIVLFLVYVGAETGLAYFISSFVDLELNEGLLAAGCISLFWGMQITGRIISVPLNKYKYVMLFTCLVGMSISIFLVGTSPNIYMTYIFVGMAGLFCGPIYPLITSIGISFAPQKSATVSGFYIASSGIGGMLIPIAVGSIGGQFNYRISFYALGAFVLIGVCSYAFFFFKSKRNRKLKIK
ncbi:MAG: MFS transporter [Bacilli bacterium]